MLRFWAVLLSAMFLLSPAVSADAYGYRLYVRNRPFAGPTSTVQGRVQAPVDEVLKALGYSWSLNGTTLEVASTGNGGNTVAPGIYTITFNGKPTGVVTAVKNNRTFVDVGSLAKGCGLAFTITEDLGTAELVIPRSKVDVATTTTAAATANAGKAEKKAAKKPKLNAKGQIETDGSNLDSPIKVLDVPFVDTTTAAAEFVGEVRTSVSFVNGGTEDLTGVSVTLQITSPNGDVFNEWKENIGILKAGAEYNFIPDPPVWFNYNKITASPKVIIAHDPLPEPEPEAAAATTKP